MLPVQLKIGSAFSLPLPTGVNAQSNDAGTLTVTTGNGRVAVQALKTGKVSIVFTYGTDIMFSLAISVVP